MINIHGVVQGPHQQPDSYNEGEWCMIVVAVVDGIMEYDFELYSDDFDFLYEIQRHCLSSLDPYILDNTDE